MPGNVSLTQEFDTLWSTTRAHVVPKIFDNITPDIPTIYYLMARERVKFVTGGSAYQFSVYKEAPQITGAAPRQGGITPDYTETMTRGEYRWKHLYAPVRLSVPEILANQGNVEKTADLVMSVVEQVRMALTAGVGGAARGIWSTADETQRGVITGLPNLIAVTAAGNTAGTTGNIARSNAWWQNTIGTAVTDYSAHGITRVQGAMINAQRGNDGVDALITSATTLQNHLAALQATYQYNLPLDLRAVSQQITDVAVPGINFHGALMFKDAGAPASTLRGLNTKYIWLFIHRDRNLVFDDQWTRAWYAGHDAIDNVCMFMGNLAAVNLEQSFGISGTDSD